MHSPEDRVARLAAALIGSARSGSPIDGLTAEQEPADQQEAYAVQDAVLAASGAHRGWKVTLARPEAPSTCAPLLAAAILPNGAQVPRGGFAALEVELALELDRDLPADRAADGAAVEQAIGRARLAFELIASRYRDRKAVGRLAVLADAQSQGAVVLGARAVPWATLPLADIDIRLEIDGAGQGQGAIVAPRAAYHQAVGWLAAHVAARGQPLRAGQVILTGARIGPVPLAGEHRFAARCPVLGTLGLGFF